MRGRLLPLGLITALLLAGGLPPHPAQADKEKEMPIPVFAPEVVAKIRAVVEPYIEAEAIVGMSIGIVDGRRELVLGFGRVDVDKAAVPDESTVYEIGSVSKALTGILLAHEVVTERTKLSTPIETLFPKWKLKVRGTDDTPITLLDVATHTSGLPRMPDNFKPQDPLNPYVDYGLEEFRSFLLKWKPTRAPGDRYEYSNLALGLLGNALAGLAKTSYEALLIDRIAKPLGMKDTRTTFTPDMKQRLARPHLVDTTPTSSWDLPAFAGAGGIRSTVSDMLQLTHAALKPDDTTLGKALEMALAKQRRAKNGPAVGLGWIIGDDGLRWHNGQTGGYHSYMALEPKAKRGIVMLANTATPVVDRIADDIRAILQGESPGKPEVKAPIAVETPLLDQLAGTYALTPTLLLTVTREGRRLMVQATGQQAFRVFPESETVWHYRVVKARITFARNGEGKATQLTLHQGGRDMVAARQD